jgi:hypothetical protein
MGRQGSTVWIADSGFQRGLSPDEIQPKSSCATASLLLSIIIMWPLPVTPRFGYVVYGRGLGQKYA